MSIGCGINVTLLIWLIDAIAVSLPRPTVCQHTRRLADGQARACLHIYCAHLSMTEMLLLLLLLPLSSADNGPGHNVYVWVGQILISISPSIPSASCGIAIRPITITSNQISQNAVAVAVGAAADDIAACLTLLASLELRNRLPISDEWNLTRFRCNYETIAGNQCGNWNKTLSIRRVVQATTASAARLPWFVRFWHITYDICA